MRMKGCALRFESPCSQVAPITGSKYTKIMRKYIVKYPKAAQIEVYVPDYAFVRCLLFRLGAVRRRVRAVPEI
jgi:hypothetical protein